MGEALLFSQNNRANSGAKHKEQWLSIEDPSWVTVHNNITLPNSDLVNTITLHFPTNANTIECTVYNELTQSINLIPNSIICIKNIFTTTATEGTLTTDERYVYYYDNQYNLLGQSTHDFSAQYFVTPRIATAYPCSCSMINGSSYSTLNTNYDIVQLTGHTFPSGYNLGILVPEDGIVNIAIGRSKDKYNNLSRLPITCTTQYSYVNFLEHFSAEEYEYHTTLKSFEDSSFNNSNHHLAPYFNQISNSYIPTVEAVDEMPYNNAIFLYNGTLYAFTFYSSTTKDSSRRYKVYK